MQRSQHDHNQAPENRTTAPVNAGDEQAGSIPVRGEGAPGATSLSVLADLVESAIARIETHQLRMLDFNGEPKGVFACELLLRDDHADGPIGIEIEHHAGRTDDESGSLGVTCRVQIPVGDFGTIGAWLCLAQGQVSVVLSADQSSTLQLLESHRDELCAGLRAAGLGESRIICSPRLPAATSSSDGPLLSTSI